MKNYSYLKWIISACLALTLGACAGASVTRLTDKTYPAKSENCKIKVFAADPKEPFEQVGLITAKGGQTIFEGSDMDTMLPLMKKEACKLGADALVIKNVAEGGMTWVTAKERGNASAMAIKLYSKHGTQNF